MPVSNSPEQPLPVDHSVSRCVRTLDVYPLAPLQKAHDTPARSHTNTRVSLIFPGSRTSQKLAAAAATAAYTSPSSLVSSPALKQPVTEASYRLSSQEVQSRAQNALTEQVRSLLEARLQERLQQARAAQARWEEEHRPPVPATAKSLFVPPYDTQVSSALKHSAPSSATAEVNGSQPLAKEEPSLQEVLPFTIQALPTRGTSEGDAAATCGQPSPDSLLAPESSSEMSIDAHPYSAVDLVRVHRLKGIPTHKRGLYSGLVNRCFTTRSGHYTIGRGSDEHGRVRSGVSGFLLGVRRHTDALSLSPPRLKMQSICTDSEVLFQWTEGDDAQYAVFEEDEMLAPHRSGRSASRNLSRTSDLLVLSLKQFLERTYGKQMSAEQREEAVRLLRERRGTQHRKSGGHPPLDSKKADGGRHLLSTEGAMMALEEFLQNEANAGSFGVGESRHQRRTKSNAISGSESASPNSKHQVIVVQDLSPTVLESDSSMNPPILATETMSHNCGDQLLDTMAPGHLLSLGADGGGSRHLVDGEESTSTLATSSPYSSCRTSNPEGAAALRRKRQARLKLIDSIARSGSGGDDRCVPLGKLRRSSRDANRFLLGLDFDAQSPKSTDAAPFDMREETVGPVERPTTAPGEPQSDAHRISSVGAGANSDMGETAGLGVGGDDRFDTGDVKKVFSKARTSAGRGVPALKTQEHSSEPVSGVAVAAAGSSLEDPPKGSPNHSREDSPKSDPIDSESTGSLNEFLMLFPEQKNHVELRRTAKSILDGVEEMWDDNDMKDFLLPNFQHSNWEHSRRDDLAGAGNADELPREPSEDLKEDDSFTGFCVSDEALIAKFRIDAEEEFSALVARRDALRAELADQSTLLRDFGEDAHYLSVGEARSGMTAEQYAIALTHMVHSYSLSHRLHLNCALEETIAREVHGDCKEDNNVEGAAEGFLDHFWRGRSDMVDVGCQVSDADLCYVDAAVRSTEQKLEDLILHERALVGAVRLTTVAVANIMAFHASLEMESTCRECFYVFNKPRTLWPCGHTFCFACLTNMYNSRGELICSECGSICETGYTPNIAIELISNYQTLCQRDETHSGIENGGAIVEERSQTIEGVLRSLLNELLAAQSSWSTHLAV